MTAGEGWTFCRVPAWALVSLFALLGCQAPAPQGPTDPAPPPPGMPGTDDGLAGARVMAWQCADDSRFETRFDGERDVLHIVFAGQARELARERGTAWSDDSVRFSSGAEGVQITWQGEVVRCEQVPVEAGGDPRR